MGTIGEAFAKLRELAGQKAVIACIGNTLKGDDGAGPSLCQKLKGRTSVKLIDAGTVPENYIQPIISSAPDVLLIVDAIDLGAPPGTIRIFEPDQLDRSAFSTHTLSPRVFVEMICKATKCRPVFIGIQPGQVKLGEPISPEVKRAVGLLAEALAGIFPA